RDQLRAWVRGGLATYGETRDLAEEGATSRLSWALSLGCLSPVEVATACEGAPGGGAFVRQLCWRDFFAQLLCSRDELEHRSPRPEPEWVDDDAGFDAWVQGRTGFPLVDASMRQLTDEGFMPYRNRMAVASFLTKDLRVDWRRGAAHFEALLCDHDVASNQLNWQWVAGTGTGANPHRVLNPHRQAERADPTGAYVRRWLDGADLRRPPIVEHAAAIDAWRHAMRGARLRAAS
ncbi:MAG TPA: FAD-binding domain-containing protein, partial [Acidimicrobiales bacterium]|nr:FAD-binding domain-containing protein [Acidimicrobiales bacterium]